jgi:predicted amidohydrolase YtcJ
MSHLNLLSRIALVAFFIHGAIPGRAQSQSPGSTSPSIAEPADLITGGQWNAASFDKQAVHRSLLDSVAPDNPVVLSDISMLADLLVLDRNPFKLPVAQIHETKVKLTFINGEVVYQAPTSTRSAD